MSGFKTTICLFTDGSGARGILQRQGVGRVRHLSCRILWLQDLINGGSIKLCTVAGAMNPADIGTKRLPAARMRSLMSLLGMYDTSTGAIEGSDDPGRLFQKKHHVMMILSALGLLQMKGCDEVGADEASGTSYGMMVSTLVLGFIFLVFWFCMRRNGQVIANLDDENEPNATPAVSNEPTVIDDEMVDTTNVASSSSSTRPPTVEGYLNWPLERCCRRRDNALTHERRLLYEERVTILHGLKFAIEGPDEAFRSAALRTLGNMSDISDDEESPNYASINAEHTSVEQAMVAYNFILGLQSGSSTGTGFSTNIDTLYNAIGAGRHIPGGPQNMETEDSEVSSDGHGETRSEAMRRYQQSSWDEVSDLELWMEIHNVPQDEDRDID